MPETVWFVVILLVVFWLVGLAIRTVGRIVHILLVIAAAIVLYNLLLT
ncbi:MAG: lmo0937 family membrane protein [Chloroflexota bacterium]|nr:lmo0937 family membrane protein [Chloroflexota bacterium]